MKGPTPADVLGQMAARPREAALGWIGLVWNLGSHGLPLAEALMDAAPGKIDGLDAADRLIRAMEEAGWIERGKLELHTLARRMSAGSRGNSARPLDYFWSPIRGAASRPFWDLIWPDADEETIERCSKAYGWTS